MRVRSAGDIERAIERHGDAVWRVAVLYFHAHADAHCKAWLIRVTANVCKDMLKAASRRAVSLDDAVCAASNDPATQPASFSSEVVDAMRSLDDPPRTPLYLSLYEGYTAPEIAQMVDAPVNTVYSWLARGKKQLQEVLS